jgi:predicted type IV restriction endonuclease
LDLETRANYLATIILLKKFPCQTIELTYEKIKIRWQQKSEVFKSSIKTLQILSQMRLEEKIFALKARI